MGCEKIRYDPICGPPIPTNRRRNLRERERRGREKQRERERERERERKRENSLSCWKLVLEFSRNLEYKGCRLASFPRKLAAASRSEQRVIAPMLSNLLFPPTASTVYHIGFASSEYLKRYATHAVLKKMQIWPKSSLCKIKVSVSVKNKISVKSEIV